MTRSCLLCCRCWLQSSLPLPPKQKWVADASGGGEGVKREVEREVERERERHTHTDTHRHTQTHRHTDTQTDRHVHTREASCRSELTPLVCLAIGCLPPLCFLQQWDNRTRSRAITAMSALITSALEFSAGGDKKLVKGEIVPLLPQVW